MQKTITTLMMLVLLAACGRGSTPTGQQTLTPSEPPTATPPAEVAVVNQEGVTLESYTANLRMFQDAQAETGTLLATEDVRQTVIDSLVDRLLLAQAARAAGFVADDALLDERIAAVSEQAGGQEALAAWLAEHGLSAESFREELRLELEAAHMVAEISAGVPSTAEQVEARQVLLPDLFSAERLLGQLDGGASFESVVQNNDPRRLGTLGWFPRGYLLQPEVEEAAFALQPGEYSRVVESELGFHLIQVLARDANRPLSPQARLALQTRAVQDWLSQRRAESAIEIRLPD